MPRRALLLALALALTGCPDRHAPAPESVAHPGTASVTTGTLLAGFSDVKVGDVYTYELLGGGERTDTVKARSDDELTLERAMAFGSAEARPELVTVSLRSPSAFEAPKDARVVTLGKESVVISGRAFECVVHETTFPGNTVREWVTPGYPFVLKSVANGFMTLRLKEIRGTEKSP